MKAIMSNQLQDAAHAVPYRPAIAIIMPFEPKMGSKNFLTAALKKVVDKVEALLTTQYPDDIHQLMTKKLQLVMRNLDYSTHKKSIAIFLSPVFEKLLYLDMQVKERIIIDTSFEIRDVVYSKIHLHQYLLLVLGPADCHIYLGNGTSVVRILSSKPEHANAYKRTLTGGTGNFCDPEEAKEITAGKFLHHVDLSLNIILNAYNLPLFVSGTGKVLDDFKKLTQHDNSVIEYIQGSYTEVTVQKLAAILEPYITDWKKVQQKNLFNQLSTAANENKLAAGMNNVWREAAKNKGRLLLVENNFVYAAEQGSIDEVIYKAIEPYNKFSYVQNAVDDVIEKVLAGGGAVEFVADGTLKEYNHIVLIQYY